MNNCDGYGPHTGDEVRILPITNNPYDGNLHLCKACHERELDHRRIRNRSLGVLSQFSLPAWDTLRVYREDLQ